MIDMVASRLGTVIAVILIVSLAFTMYHVQESAMLEEREERDLDNFAAWLDEVAGVRAEFSKTFSMYHGKGCDYVVYEDYDGQSVTVYQTSLLSSTSHGSFTSGCNPVHLFNPCNTSRASRDFLAVLDPMFETLELVQSSVYVVERRAFNIDGDLEYHTFVYDRGTVAAANWLGSTAADINDMACPSQLEILAGRINLSRSFVPDQKVTVTSGYLLTRTEAGGAAARVNIGHLWPPSEMNKLQQPLEQEDLDSLDDVDPATEGIQHAWLEVAPGQEICVERVKISILAETGNHVVQTEEIVERPDLFVFLE